MNSFDPFLVADVIGIIFFAISGALVASRKQLDLLGLLIASYLTALGGGIIRDIFVDRTPMSFTLIYPAALVLGTLTLFLFYRWHHKKELEKKYFFVISDTIGLVAFSVAGAILAIQYELNLFATVVLAFTTAVGGGIIRDVMINEVPAVLISDFYGSIAIIIAIALYFLNQVSLINSISILTVASLGIMIRLLAYYRGWKLPKIS